ncbi:hypothetical protein [Thiolapillus sp.]|uniref:hypothetical protein n=1 Tax=Thiolapillus sp. TaxID=2017437 RepID=UPI003AF4902A
MPVYKSILIATILLLGLSVQAEAGKYYDDVEIDVISDSRGELHQYPANSGSKKRRAYIAVRDGERYSIRVQNRTGERIGVVIAVDGRNIISGAKSHLKRGEAKYVLGPWETAEYDGWRTSRNRVHRFYFTDIGDSYADAWGDHSAMGVIAAAVFREKKPRHQGYAIQKKRESSEAADRDSAGTGFGESAWSPSHKVRFKARKKPMFRKFIKYEWRRTLCRKGIIPRCRDYYDDEPGNRFWPPDDWDDEYAPYPWSLRRHHQ